MINQNILFCGIDPGIKGAVVFLDSRGAIFHKILMPEDVTALADFFTKFCYVHSEKYKIRVFLEKAQAMPGQGVCAVFNYGKHFGSIIGILATLGCKVELIPPQAWTRAMHKGYNQSNSKEKSKALALDLFKGESFLASVRCKKPHEGFVDAALIAEYGRRLFIGEI